jgi:membrane protein required for colicin V production
VNWFDLAAGAVLAWSGFSALRRGLIREFVGLLAIVAGIYAAGRYYDDLSANLEFAIENPLLRNFVATSAIFTGIAIIGAVVSGMLKSVAAVLMLGPLDHLGGAAFGLARGFLLVELALILAATFPAIGSLNDGIEGSTLAPYFLVAVPTVEKLLPDEFTEAAQAMKERLQAEVMKQALDDALGGALPQ